MTGDPYAHAACLGADIHLFFPDHATYPRVEPEGLYAAAKVICSTCPIRVRCLDDHQLERFGVWGGTTPAERGFAPKVPTRNLRTVA